MDSFNPPKTVDERCAYVRETRRLRVENLQQRIRELYAEIDAVNADAKLRLKGIRRKLTSRGRRRCCCEAPLAWDDAGYICSFHRANPFDR